jgi:hypothetical protein
MRLFPGSNEDQEQQDPDSEKDEDPEYNDDIEGIMEYQHKILRKYAMLGMIQYSAVPFFHCLVQNRDYKMICIFEVFALNRNEDDFLENLGILNEIRLQNEDSQINTIDDSDNGQMSGDDRMQAH